MKSSLSYLGVGAATPPNLVFRKRVPVATDYKEYNVGSLWIANVLPFKILWILMYKTGGVATWMQINTSLTPGDITDVLGADNINTTNSGGPIVTVHLNTSINQPSTNASGSEGVYSLNAVDFMHGYGTQNTFLGGSAGNRGLTVLSATENTGIGFQALHGATVAELCTAVGDTALGTATTSEACTAIGHDSQALLQTGDFNTSLGGASLGRALTGNYNTSLGWHAGYGYVGAESSNIAIGNVGTAAESHVIRIGSEGAGDNQQNAAYMAGVYSSVPGGTYNVSFADDAGKLCSSRGTNGQLLIGSTAGSPIWASLASSDGSVTITNTANHIDLIAVGGGGGGGATTFITDLNSPAVINVATITFAGAGVLSTDGGGGSHVVTTSITNGTNGQLLVAGGAAPAWSNLTSTGGSMTITYPFNNTINLEAVGAGGGANTFVTDAGNAVSAAGVINVLGGTNVATVGAGQTVTINLGDSIALPITNATGTEGLYSLGGSRFLHNYGTFNTFGGGHAGNMTLTVLNAMDNTAYGSYSSSSLTTGDANATYGSDAGRNINTGTRNFAGGYGSQLNTTTGSSNCSAGAQSLNGITTGSSNTCLGNLAGSALTVADSSNILIGHAGSAGLVNTIKIGTQGAGAGQVNSTYIAGVHGVAVGGGLQFVTVDNTGKLGSTAAAAGTVTTVNGGTNITTVNPGGPVVTVNLDNVVNITRAGSYQIAGKYAAAMGHYGNSYLVGGEGTGGNYNLSIGEFSQERRAEVFRFPDPNGNTSVGYQSLNHNVFGSNTTAVGYRAGYNITYDDLSNSTFIGANTGINLYAASNCIVIGNGSGQPAPGEDTNIGYGIAIGSDMGDNSIRIGGVNHHNTYIKGIWDVDLGAAPTQNVYVDADGHLGTTSAAQCAFLGIQSGWALNVTGDGTIYWLGTITDVDVIYDLTGDYDPGDGAGSRATFTAPTDGLYFLEVQFLISGLFPPPAPPPAPPPSCGDPTIHTSNRDYKLINSVYDYQTNGTQTYFYNAICDMEAADIAQFNIEITFGAGTRTLDIKDDQTFISGYLIRRI